MVNDNTKHKRKWWPTSWVWRVVLILAIAWLLGLAFTLSTHVEYSGATTYTAAQLEEMGKTAIVVEESGFTLTAWETMEQTTATIPAGCHGRVWRKAHLKTPALIPITLAWVRTAIDRWCGNSRGEIYDWGAATGNDGSYTIAGYCLTNPSHGKVWWTPSRSEAKIWNAAQAGPCGRVLPQASLNARIYFHAATSTHRHLYFNFGDGVHRH